MQCTWTWNCLATEPGNSLTIRYLIFNVKLKVRFSIQVRVKTQKTEYFWKEEMTLNTSNLAVCLGLWITLKLFTSGFWFCSKDQSKGSDMSFGVVCFRNDSNKERSKSEYYMLRAWSDDNTYYTNNTWGWHSQNFPCIYWKL